MDSRIINKKDFWQDTRMISEDYVSKEAIASSSWKGPLSKGHYKAIFSTIALALSLAIATNQNFYKFSGFSSEESAPENEVIASNVTAPDEEIPLAQAFGIASSKSKDQFENYDDTLNEAELADSDEIIDQEVSALASKTDKEEAGSFGAKWVTENVQKGDSISSLFEDLNIPAATLATIIDNNKPVAKSINSLKIGEKLSFLVDSKGELIVFIKPISDKEQLRFYKVDNTGKFAYTKEKLNSYVMDDDAVNAAKALAEAPSAKTDSKAIASADKKAVPAVVAEDKVKKEVPAGNKRGRLVVVTINKGETFSKAANKAGITYSEINRILQMFRGKIQFSRNIQAGDTMRVLFTDSNGKGKICAVEFQMAKGGKIASYLNTADGKYYDEKGLNATHSSFSRFPFRSRVRVTSQFNPSRKHPVTGIRRPHNGVDFGLPVGTMITAPADGIVDKATFSRSAGYWLTIRHTGGLSTVYMHLSKISVRPGQRIKQGTVIARSGNTGLSTGPHLHYEIRVNGRAVNPLRINLDNRNYNINSKARKAFAASVQRYKKELHQSNLIAKR